MKERMLQLRSEGKTYAQIAEELGCAKSTVCYHIGSNQKTKSLWRQKSGRDQKIKRIREYKEQQGCLDCNQKFPHYVLEFDHRDPSTKINTVSRMARGSTWQQTWEEIQKCDVVCSNCHSTRTWNRYQN